jgi:thiamine-monophosphate kinase
MKTPRSRDTEKPLIQKLLAPFASAGQKPILVPAGTDDAAILNWGGSRLAVTMDTLTESVDFEHSWMPSRFLGYKSLAVNLSDLAAMGAAAQFAMLSVTLNKARFSTKKLQSQFFTQFSRGFHSCASEFGVQLIGGDLGSSLRETSVSVCVFGHAPRRPLKRNGAKPGDLIVVAGHLGLARRGLRSLMANKKPTRREAQAFFKPKPLIKLGARLSQIKAVHAAMDISDGLSRDLGRLCSQNQLGFEVDLKSLREPERLDAWVGGEDYALLLAVDPRGYALVQEAVQNLGVSLWHLGTFSSQTKLQRVVGLPGSKNGLPAGFEHF